MQPGAVDQLDRVLAADLGQRFVAIAEQRVDELAEAQADQPAVETSDGLVPALQFRAPTPMMGIELGAIVALIIDPAQVERREDADGDAVGVAVANAEVVGGKAAHRHTRQDMRLALAADGVVLDEEVPNVARDEVFEIAGVAVQEEAARG